jgi:hypothetical protein
MVFCRHAGSTLPADYFAIKIVTHPMFPPPMYNLHTPNLWMHFLTLVHKFHHSYLPNYYLHTLTWSDVSKFADSLWQTKPLKSTSLTK